MPLKKPLKTDEQQLIKRFGLKKVRTNKACTIYQSPYCPDVSIELFEENSETTRVWWRAMNYEEFTHLYAIQTLPELNSGQYLSPAAWYSAKYMTNEKDNDYLVSLTYYGESSFLGAIRNKFSTMDEVTKKSWQKSEGVKINNIKGNGWEITQKPEKGIMSIGVGSTGSNPFVTTILQDFMAEGKIKWRLERMLSRSYHD